MTDVGHSFLPIIEHMNTWGETNTKQWPFASTHRAEGLGLDGPSEAVRYRNKTRSLTGQRTFHCCDSTWNLHRVVRLVRTAVHWIR